MSAPFLERSLGEMLTAVAERTPAPGGGAVAGLSVALAASLCAMAARFSEGHLERAGEIAAAADRLGARAIVLAEEDAAAYGAVLAARRRSAGTSRADRQETLANVMAHAVAVPLEIAELGAELARLATEVASGGNPNLLGDALTAVLIAEAAAASAATLVEINMSDEVQS